MVSLLGWECSCEGLYSEPISNVSISPVEGILRSIEELLSVGNSPSQILFTTTDIPIKNQYEGI